MTSRLIAGIRPGNARPADEGLDGARRAWSSVGALRGQRERRTRVGEDEQLEVIVGVHVLVEPREHVVERARLIDPVDPERRNRAHGHRSDRAERPQRHPASQQVVALAQVDDLTAARDEAQPYDLGRDVREARAGAVRGGANRARERLGIDISLVLERKAACRELRAQVADRDAGLDRDLVALDVQQAVHPREVDHHPIRAGDVGERVPGADDLDPRRPGDSADQLGLVSWPLDALGRTALVARPVRPCAGHDSPGGYDAADFAAASTFSGSGAQWASASIGWSRR